MRDDSQIINHFSLVYLFSFFKNVLGQPFAAVLVCCIASSIEKGCLRGKEREEGKIS